MDQTSNSAQVQAMPAPQILTAFWLGITGLVFAVAGVGFLIAVPAIVLGHLVLWKIKTGQVQKAGKRFAVIGLVAAYVGTIAGLSMTIIAVMVVRDALSGMRPVRIRKDKLERATAAEAAALTPAQKKWILATTAINVAVNNETQGVIGACRNTPSNAEMVRRRLKSGWGITNPATLLKTTKWLAEEGHRKEFEAMAFQLARMSPEKRKELLEQARENPQLENQLRIVSENHERLGDKSLYAWDYCRYIRLCGWGYLAGYITEEEAWQLALPAARKLQSTFDSWEDMGENFLLGRKFWSLQNSRRDGARYVNAFRRMRDSRTSLWKRCRWDTGLGRAAPAPAPEKTD